MPLKYAIFCKHHNHLNIMNTRNKYIWEQQMLWKGITVPLELKTSQNGKQNEEQPY